MSRRSAFQILMKIEAMFLESDLQSEDLLLATAIELLPRFGQVSHENKSTATDNVILSLITSRGDGGIDTMLNN